MAISNYQTPTKIKLFTSYPQYAYAAGLITDTDTNNIADLSEEERFKLITLDPTSTTKIIGNISAEVFYRFKDSENNANNFDYFMVLGHKLYHDNLNIIPQQCNFEGTNSEAIQDVGTTGFVNYPIAYNGWSATTLTDTDSKDSFGFKITSDNDNQNIETDIGSILWGKSCEAPQNVDLNNSVSYNYGFKQKKTIGGKTISNMNYYKPNKWLLDAWELSETKSDERNVATESRNGIRTWSVSWSFLQDKYAMPQNSMTNSNGWTRDSNSDYYIGADEKSLYNSSDGIDFITSVIKPTMGGHLPMVARISESNNPDQYAIVRMSKLSINQKNPKFVDIKLTLEEQV